MNTRKTLLSALLALALLGTASADKKSELLSKWNSEPGRDIQLKSDDVLIKESNSELFTGLIAAGFRQSDGQFSLGRIVWNGETHTPLKAFGTVLKSKGFESMDDQARSELFLSLLKETYGALGTKPYTGTPSKRKDRPWPIVGLRAPDDSHRFQVWYYELPINKEHGEWREVLYSINADGSSVRARTLGTYHPEGEKLRHFPTISSELFE